MADGDLLEGPMRELSGVMKCSVLWIECCLYESIHFQTYLILHLRSVHFNVLQILPELKKKC